MKELQELQDKQGKWSDKTFAGGQYNPSRSIPISHHLQKETEELTEALEEYFNEDVNEENWEAMKFEIADCFLLLIDISHKIGMDMPEIVEYSEKKYQINKVRVWGEPDENGVIEHIRD